MLEIRYMDVLQTDDALLFYRVLCLTWATAVLGLLPREQGLDDRDVSFKPLAPSSFQQL